ncbi:hypothetical protein PS862_05187 [Pseudomonas fluorescens]|uniref:N-acetyltransferase domain-containing protein n=2 Tax=Pseudomonas fluorescens TaxID=294 RepID=A0A5E7PDT1_PSEFL|nr:hypothetical protein PS862_05187 [Pseudomonas fluorescens]
MMIRETDIQDWEYLKSIRLQALSDSPIAFGVSHADAVNYSDERWRSLASAQQAPYFWLAIDQELPVGMIGGGIDRQRRFNLIGMWVKHELRGGGVAQRLVEVLRARALSLGFERMVLGVSPSNARATNFYKRQGFVFIDEFEWLASHPDITVQTMEWIDPAFSAPGPPAS